MQTENVVLDNVARLFTNAAGAAQALRAEVEALVKTRLERLLNELDLVPREEFEAVKAMAAKARAENARLAKRIAALESHTGVSGALPSRPMRPKAPPLGSVGKRKIRRKL